MQKFTRSLVAGLALFVGCASTPSLEERAETLYEQGSVHMVETDADAAVRAFTQAIGLDDNETYRWARYGANLSLSIQRKHRQAEYGNKMLKDADAYIKFLPEDPTGYVLRATARATIIDGAVYEPLQDLTKAITLINTGQKLRFFKEHHVRAWHLKLSVENSQSEYY